VSTLVALVRAASKSRSKDLAVMLALFLGFAQYAMSYIDEKHKEAIAAIDARYDVTSRQILEIKESLKSIDEKLWELVKNDRADRGD
jgi:uncharacterized protein with HEPN domain